jgi:hypothetical protein
MSRATLDTYSSSNRGLDRFLASAGRPPRSRIVRSAASVFEMVQSILQDRKRVLSCAVYLHGEYKTRDLFVGVLVVLGSAGMERVIEIEFSPEEQTQSISRPPR